MLRLFDNACILEMQPLADDDAPGDGHLRLAIRVRSDSFAGEARTRVDAHGLARFARALQALGRAAGGAAVLASIAPNELHLRMHAADGGGRVAVSGSIGAARYVEGVRLGHAVSFGFEFERSQLDAALAVPWLRASLG